MSLEPTTLYKEMMQKANGLITAHELVASKRELGTYLLPITRMELEIAAAEYRVAFHKAREQGRVGQHGRWF